MRRVSEACCAADLAGGDPRAFRPPCSEPELKMDRSMLTESLQNPSLRRR